MFTFGPRRERRTRGPRMMTFCHMWHIVFIFVAMRGTRLGVHVPRVAEGSARVSGHLRDLMPRVASFSLIMYHAWHATIHIDHHAWDRRPHQRKIHTTRGIRIK